MAFLLSRRRYIKAERRVLQVSGNHRTIMERRTFLWSLVAKCPVAAITHCEARGAIVKLPGYSNKEHDSLEANDAHTPTWAYSAMGAY